MTQGRQWSEALGRDDAADRERVLGEISARLSDVLTGDDVGAHVDLVTALTGVLQGLIARVPETVVPVLHDASRAPPEVAAAFLLGRVHMAHEVATAGISKRKVADFVRRRGTTDAADDLPPPGDESVVASDRRSGTSRSLRGLARIADLTATSPVPGDGVDDVTVGRARDEVAEAIADTFGDDDFATCCRVTKSGRYDVDLTHRATSDDREDVRIEVTFHDDRPGLRARVLDGDGREFPGGTHEVADRAGVDALAATVTSALAEAAARHERPASGLRTP